MSCHLSVMPCVTVVLCHVLQSYCAISIARCAGHMSFVPYIHVPLAGSGVIPADLFAGGPVGSVVTVRAKVEHEAFKHIPEAVIINRPLYKVHCGFVHKLMDERDEVIEASRRKRGGTAAVDPVADGGDAGPSDAASGGRPGGEALPSAAAFPGISCFYKLDLLNRTTAYSHSPKLLEPLPLSAEAWSLNHTLLDSLEVEYWAVMFNPAPVSTTHVSFSWPY